MEAFTEPWEQDTPTHSGPNWARARSAHWAKEGPRITDGVPAPPGQHCLRSFTLRSLVSQGTPLAPDRLSPPSRAWDSPPEGLLHSATCRLSETAQPWRERPPLHPPTSYMEQ